MPSAKRQLEPASALPPVGRTDLQVLLGPAPLLDGEDPDTYQALFSHTRAAVEPNDAIEEFWLRDVVDLLWETLRLRRLKAALMRAAAHEGLAKVLTPLVPNFADRTELVRAWASKSAARVWRSSPIQARAFQGSARAPRSNDLRGSNGGQIRIKPTRESRG